MKNIYDQIGYSSKVHYNKLRKLIEPLTQFCGVDRFWRNAHGADGSYSLLGNHPPTAESFFGQELYKGHPYFRNPVFFRSGYVIPGLAHSVEYETTQGVLTKEGDCYHVFLVIQKTAKGVIEYGFATSKLCLGFETRYLNHLPAFKQFIHYFEREATKIIQESSERYRIKISDIIGSSYNERPDLVDHTIVPDNELRFFAAMQQNPERAKALLSLTKSEKAILGHYLLGATTKEIAKKQHRSPRTIETHMDNAKTKLGVSTRSEVFDILFPYHEFLQGAMLS